MNTQEKFDLYMEGLLSEKEVQELKEQLLTNPELNNEFSQYREANFLLEKNLSSSLINPENDPVISSLTLDDRLIIENEVDNYLSDPLKKNEESFRETTKKLFTTQSYSGRLTANPLFRVAAFLAFFVMITALLFITVIPEKKLSSDEIFEKYYRPLDDKTLKLNSSNQEMQLVIAYFRKSDYDSASSGLDAISHIYDTEYLYHILKGLILLEKNNPEIAGEFFITAMNKADNVNKYSAKWYYGLTCLKENDPEAALKAFSDLSKTKNPYSRNAKKIIATVKLD